MTTAEFKDEAIKRLERVPPKLRATVLSYLEGVGEKTAGRVRGTPGRDLLKFAGTISDETAERMKQVIEEECERIDYDSWGLPAGHEHGDRPAP